ncbi:MAG TPA: esterase-like activity of phytase family protein [Candidatus Binatia bacterium]|nr:esterase-like activity of phytase family protein [Candidatus Binatia bacterium]
MPTIVSRRSIVTCLISALLFAPSVSCTTHRAGAADSRLVELIPFELDRKNPERKEFGALTLLSAFELRSRDKRFGGISGLAIDPGGNLYAVSDAGYWVSAKMISAPDGRLLDLIDWRITPLLTPERKPVGGVLRDAEALSRAPDGGFVVAFEQAHRIWRYPPPPLTFQSPPVALPAPREIARAPGNGGIEGITFLPDGQLLALTEEFQNADGSFRGWLIDNNRFAELSYLPSDGFRVTDCAGLKNGDVIVVERRYVPFGTLSARLKLIRGNTIQPAAKLAGEELMRLEPPLHVDNFEAVAIHEDPLQGTTIYIVSDDNYNLFQRTLLLQFRLAGVDTRATD